MDTGGFLDSSGTTLSDFFTPSRRNCLSERQVSTLVPLEEDVTTTPAPTLALVREIALTRVAEAPKKAKPIAIFTNVTNRSVA